MKTGSSGSAPHRVAAGVVGEVRLHREQVPVRRRERSLYRLHQRGRHHLADVAVAVAVDDQHGRAAVLPPEGHQPPLPLQHLSEAPGHVRRVRPRPSPPGPREGRGAHHDDRRVRLLQHRQCLKRLAGDIRGRHANNTHRPDRNSGGQRVELFGGGVAC
eukprot:1186084-Prorocentrum_minimum.AAC.2